MDIEATIYPRGPIESLGIAPLTSMFLSGENDHHASDDFRPEIHDSDGLALWTGKGERIWRPLVDPLAVRVNAFADDNPRGFGLMQRDRNFDHYQDDGVFYDRRPSVWVEPKPDADGRGWGRGAVRLVEIPTTDETSDNIVAFWQWDEAPRGGDELVCLSFDVGAGRIPIRRRWPRSRPRGPAPAGSSASREPTIRGASPSILPAASWLRFRPGPRSSR